ncbi:type II toxin-antitoxin system PemK/MazF family toxin [Weissella sp. MSCH1]|uniref:type II toxin-antitoxin system PemK/MazF family toxin n=1 Tax=Weissella sp. MSCH1 TaxID=3383343 RepID=UPI003896B634
MSNNSVNMKFDQANKNFKEVQSSGEKKYSMLHHWTFNKSRYLLDEVRRKVKRNKKTYKRGAIIYVDYGVNIGGEFSGPHFSVVLNNFDSKNNEKLTVIPLTSKEHANTIELTNTIQETSMEFLSQALYDILKVPIAEKVVLDTLLNKLDPDHEITNPTELVESITDIKSNTEPETPANASNGIPLPDGWPNRMVQELSDFKTSLDYVKTYIAQTEGVSKKEVTGEMLNSYIHGAKFDSLIKNAKDLFVVFDKYKQYNLRTFARPMDITTVSKRRIRKINKFDPIGKIKVSSETLNAIEDGIKQLYFKKVDN